MSNTKTNEIECIRLVAKPFTDEERASVKKARKKKGIDRPVFYHDAVVAYADKINKEISNG